MDDVSEGYMDRANESLADIMGGFIKVSRHRVGSNHLVRPAVRKERRATAVDV